MLLAVPPAEEPYRASGLVLWPKSEVQHWQVGVRCWRKIGLSSTGYGLQVRHEAHAVRLFTAAASTGPTTIQPLPVPPPSSKPGLSPSTARLSCASALGVRRLAPASAGERRGHGSLNLFWSVMRSRRFPTKSHCL
jgi:hypothetical protein